MRQPSTTPVPNVIFDIHLKDLNLAELKVLFIVIRQTLGWVDRRAVFGRKESDWISGNQLREKTGSSKRAISSAIDVLVEQRLIEILDERGDILDQPEKRQGKMKLYYRLHPYVYNYVDNITDNLTSSANFAPDLCKKVTELVQKMQITKETIQN
jgi:biotin operon repressor